MPVCVCVSVRPVCNNFLYSITETILPGSSPHLVRTFFASIPLFLLLWAHLKKQDGRHANFSISFSIEIPLQTSHIPTVKLLLPTQTMHLHYIFPLEGRSNKLILHWENIFSPFNLFTITQKRHSLYKFWRWLPFSRWLPWGNCVFLFPFPHWPFFQQKNQPTYWSFWIYTLEYWLEIWDISFTFALFLPAEHR